MEDLPRELDTRYIQCYDVEYTAEGNESRMRQPDRTDESDQYLQGCHF